MVQAVQNVQVVQNVSPTLDCHPRVDFSRQRGIALSKNKRSPLKSKPLRNPGQSLDEQIHDLIYDQISAPLFLAVIAVLFAGLEWLRYFRPHDPAPVVYSFGAILLVIYAAFRIYKAWPGLRALKLGRDGEKAVGQFLDVLRERGYRVFHDVIGDSFNLDHVLIGPAGVFTVETKTYSKPMTGNPAVVLDGEKVLVNGFEPDRDPIVQARAQASWLRELLAESTGRNFEVTPVIVYPGWFVEYTGPKNRTIWVLNPKGRPAFLDHAPPQLSRDDVQLASFHLGRVVRVG